MISSSNRMLGLALSRQSCPRMEPPISPTHQIGPTSHLEQDISCAILEDQVSVLVVHLQRLYQESVQLALWMEWRVTAQRSQHLHRAQGHLLKVFPQVRHFRLANTDSSTAILRTLERGSSLASAISRTFLARARLMHHCQRKSLFKKQTVRLTTKALSWPDIYQDYTPSNRLRTNRSIQANYTDTRIKQRVVLIKTSTLAMVSGQRRDLMGRRQHR
jgi:hypothetical protein